jgi:hypothetical protein
MSVDDLRQRLERSRAALLQALEGLTDRDFAAELEPELTVVGALASLAPAERQAVRRAREAVGAPPRPLPSAGSTQRARALPPQVVHDLAGARYETLLFLDSLREEQLAVLADGERVEALLARVAEREVATAERVQGRASESANPA